MFGNVRLTRAGRIVFGGALVYGAIAAGLAYVNRTNSTSARAAGPVVQNTQEASVERGKYLVTVVGCNDCHTPLKMGASGPEPDMSRMLSGHPQQLKLPAPPRPQGPWVWSGSATNTAFAGPWGVTYAPNLTPDVNTGMGIWTEEMFVKAMRTGRHFGQARPIQPPMPWQALSRMTDQDLKSIYAYLRSIPPVTNLVPDYQPPAADAGE